jgi:hypothetical protein
MNEELDPFYQHVKCIISFLQLIFSKRPKGSFRFVEGPEDKESEIVIAGIKALKAATIPRIVVARGPAQSVSVAMDNLYTWDAQTGSKKYRMLLSMPISINIIANIDTEAQEMAWFVQKQLLAHRDIIRKVGNFHKIDSNISMTPPTDYNAILAPEVKSEASLVQLGLATIIPYGYTTHPVDRPLLVRVKNSITLDK